MESVEDDVEPFQTLGTVLENALAVNGVVGGRALLKRLLVEEVRVAQLRQRRRTPEVQREEVVRLEVYCSERVISRVPASIME